MNTRTKYQYVKITKLSKVLHVEWNLCNIKNDDHNVKLKKHKIWTLLLIDLKKTMSVETV